MVTILNLKICYVKYNPVSKIPLNFMVSSKSRLQRRNKNENSISDLLPIWNDEAKQQVFWHVTAPFGIFSPDIQKSQKLPYY